MIVVADTSPIINLAAIGQINLLQHLYGTVRIPDAVCREIVDAGAGEPGSAEVRDLGWIEHHTVSQLELVTPYALNLIRATSCACRRTSDSDGVRAPGGTRHVVPPESPDRHRRDVEPD